MSIVVADQHFAGYTFTTPPRSVPVKVYWQLRNVAHDGSITDIHRYPSCVLIQMFVFAVKKTSQLKMMYSLKMFIDMPFAAVTCRYRLGYVFLVRRAYVYIKAD